MQRELNGADDLCHFVFARDIRTQSLGPRSEGYEVSRIGTALLRRQPLAEIDRGARTRTYERFHRQSPAESRRQVSEVGLFSVEEKLGQGKENARVFLKENPKVLAKIEKEILEKAIKS